MDTGVRNLVNFNDRSRDSLFPLEKVSKTRFVYFYDFRVYLSNFGKRYYSRCKYLEKFGNLQGIRRILLY